MATPILKERFSWINSTRCDV